jgi:homoserine O-acetyltransferase
LESKTFERDVSVGSVALDCGVTLHDVVQRVTCYGEPRADFANVVLVNHALTGSSHVADWWRGIIGPGKLLDTDRLAVIGINNLGSCYGSTGPTSTGPSGRPYGSAFPVVSVADIVRAQMLALRQLGITHLAAVAGGSLGGMQALQWAVHPSRCIDHAIVIGAYDYLAPMAIALNYVARQAISTSKTPEDGIALARKIAMLTYKSDALFAQRFGRKVDRNGGDPTRRLDDRFDVEGYLDYQGRIFAARMDTDAYVRQTRAMDLFDLREVPLPATPPKFTFVGISSDWLFLPQYVREAAQRYARDGADSVYLEMNSSHGHDAFLAEPESLTAILAARVAPLYEALGRASPPWARTAELAQ